MKTVLRIALGSFVSLIVLLGVVFIGARFADGPLEIIAGGPFSSGELVTGPEPDWAFAHDLREVEFQLVDPPRSRTTWILEHAGRIYIPCGYMTSTLGKIWKQWPIEALNDGRAILRIDDKLYERDLVRIEEGRLLEPLTAELSRKYAGGADIGPAAVTSGSLWLFELAPRS
ncbi:MAG: hypothetical protein HRU01_29595 [Myxococcales bacterium]|nr:hypothetical protein [Myxococcales bacterium]